MVEVLSPRLQDILNIPEPQTPGLAIEFVHPEHGKTANSQNRERKLKNGLNQLRNAGVIDAIRTVHGHIQDQNPVSFIGFEDEDPIMSIYYAPTEIPLSNSEQHLWKSCGIKAKLLPNGRSEVYFRQSGIHNAQNPKLNRDGGWSKIDAETGDKELLKDALKLAKTRSTPTHDLRQGSKLWQLKGKPEAHLDASVIEFNKKNVLVIIV